MDSNNFVIGDVVSVDPEIMGGVPVFKGTRVPVQIFIDHVQQQVPMEEFYEGFPSVTREQTKRLLKMVSEPLLTT